jgi:pimeloyl-ACP methyl ester carboxylesterase
MILAFLEDGTLEVDVSTKLAAVKVPVLYLGASHDRLVPAAASRLVTQLRPVTRIAEVDAPHCLLLAAPSQATALVGEFVRDTMCPEGQSFVSLQL